MKNLIIIGAGQLGSRHLQGVLKYDKEELEIYVSDPSNDALLIAKERASEVAHSHTIHFINDSSEFPKNAEIAIVATNSNVRESATYDLLEKTSLKHIILEKVLFQEVEAYGRFENVISKYLTNIYVNHPRRLTPAYNDIAKNIESVGGRGFFSVVGESWDLGCNALHMIDLFSFLSKSSLRSINTEGIDSAIVQSKRLGFLEFTGCITGLLENNDSFSITSLPGERGPLTIQVATNGNRWFIQEGGTKTILHLGADSNYSLRQSLFFQDVQSSLTTNVISSLLDNGVCGLPSYYEAAKAHKVFIGALLNKYNSLSNLNEVKCPIT
jgi:hypothetical protein